jgi:conjugative transposon TraM protein
MGNGSKKKITNYIVYTIATVVFIIVMCVLFSSPKDNSATDDLSSSLNKELPEGELNALPDSKEKAYEDLALTNGNQLRGLGTDELSIDLSLLGDSVKEVLARDSVSVSRRDDEVDAVANAKQAIQELQQQKNSRKSVTPDAEQKPQAQQEDPDMARRKAQLEELRRKNEQTQQMLLQMLQSQQQGQGQGQGAPVAGNRQEEEKPAATAGNVSVIPENHGEVATTLGSQTRRSGGFYGVSGERVQRNSIKACAYGEQVIGDGQHLRIRLLEPMMVSGQLIPAGSILVGACKIGVDRLLVSIASIEYAGVITRIALEVYDNDGQKGLYVPGSMEMEAGREIGSDIASTVGSTAASQTSMFNQQSASEQIKADVGRGVVQGTFKFLGRKLQEIKVTVQDKHKIFLVSQK